MRTQSLAMSKLTAARIAMVAATLLRARVAYADVSREDLAKANNLFEAGQKLFEAGEIELACKSFEASFAIDPQQGTRLNLADCRERQGRLLDAYELFEVGFDEAARSLKKKRLEFTRQRLSALARRLVELELATTFVEGLVIKVDGRVIPRERWARLLREPATIVIDASAPGRAPYRSEIVGNAGAHVVVEIPDLAPLAPMRVATTRGPSGHSLDLDAVAHAERGGGPRLAPLIVGGTGGALAIGGLVLGLHARAHYRDELASPGTDLDRRIDVAQREADIATVAGIAGTIALTAGLVMYVRGRRDRMIVAPTASSAATGVVIMGNL